MEGGPLAWFSSSFFISSGSGPAGVGEETDVRKFHEERGRLAEGGCTGPFYSHQSGLVSTLLLSQSNHKMETWELCPFCPHVPRVEGLVERSGQEPRFWTQVMLRLSTALTRDPRCDLSPYQGSMMRPQPVLSCPLLGLGFSVCTAG